MIRPKKSKAQFDCFIWLLTITESVGLIDPRMLEERKGLFPKASLKCGSLLLKITPKLKVKNKAKILTQENTKHFVFIISSNDISRMNEFKR